MDREIEPQDGDNESYDEYNEIEEDPYTKEELLPQPTVSALIIQTYLKQPKLNGGKSMNRISSTGNINKISSFRLK